MGIGLKVPPPPNPMNENDSDQGCATTDSLDGPGTEMNNWNRNGMWNRKNDRNFMKQEYSPDPDLFLLSM